MAIHMSQEHLGCTAPPPVRCFQAYADANRQHRWSVNGNRQINIKFRKAFSYMIFGTFISENSVRIVFFHCLIFNVNDTLLASFAPARTSPLTCNPTYVYHPVESGHTMPLRL